MRTLISDKKFSNKGFLTSPFCPMYGISAVICYVLLRHFVSNLLILFIGSFLVLSAIVVIFGFVLEKLLGFKPWDFSESFMNIGSYITLPYALLLGILGVVLIRVIIPVLNTALVLIPFNWSALIVLSLCAIILLDYVFSIVTTIRLKKKIKKLRSFSEFIDEDVPQEKINELEENYNKLFTENIIRKRLVASFPSLQTTTYVKQITDKIQHIKNDNMLEYTTVYDKDEEKPFAFGLCFTKLFFLFVIGSFLGTVFETVWTIITLGTFEIRVGLVYGPFIPVYGGGACFLTLVLYKLYKLNDTLIFVISAVVGAAFEYFCSWLQETLLGTVSWDYSDTPFNIDGRTNLMYALIWGFLGLVWVRFLYPWLSKLIEKIPKKSGSIITTVLIVFMIFDAFMSCSAIYRWQQRDAGVEAQNSFEEYLDRHFTDKFLTTIFPHMENADDTGVTTSGKFTANEKFVQSDSSYDTVIK